MNSKFRTMLAALVVGAAMALSACGGGNNAQTPAGGDATTLTVGSDGEQLAFTPANLTASAGSISVTFTNNSVAQQHNWVLVTAGDTVADAVSAEGLSAGAENDYLPSDRSNILAATSVLDGGDSETVTFTANPGTYTFVCTIPGHSALMRGELTVN